VKISQIAQLAGGLLITGICSYFFIKRMDMHQLLINIKSTEIWVVVSVALLCPVTIWFRSLRWKIILPKRNGTNKKDLFSLVAISFMVNNVLPARIGEAVRALLLWKRNKYSVSESIGSLVLERIIDVMAFSSFLFIPAFLIKGISLPFLLVYLPLFGCIVLLMMFVIYAIFPGFTKRIFAKMGRLLPGRIRSGIEKVVKGMASNLDWIFSGKKVFYVFILSYLTVMPYAIMMWLLGMNINSFGLLHGMFGVAFSAVGAAIPLAPGYVGTLHEAISRGFALIGISSNEAGAVAVLYHAIPYVVVTLMGIILLFKINVSFKEISNAKQGLENNEELAKVNKEG
jgi:uncharacterized protein (TIRG00374 family)